VHHHTPAMPSNNIRSPAAMPSASAGFRPAALCGSRIFVAVFAPGMSWMVLPASTGLAEGVAASNPPIWAVPRGGALPDDEYGRLVRRGRDLITATYAHIGPEVPNPANRYAGNNLACSNCHLEAGTKKFGLPIFGLFGQFPHYSARSGAEITIEERVNSCMSRSMNGRAMPADAARMLAIVAYIKF